MPSREAFPTKRLEGAPSDDIGWHFGTPVPGNRNNVRCELCREIIRGGITRLKQHIAHMPGQVKPCPRVNRIVRESMMKLLVDAKAKRNDSKRRKEEFEEHLRRDVVEVDNVDHSSDDQLRFSTQESLRSQHE
ncbi:unnamed protein product [Trifolium pratense]|uniref:Uncharacterized protein n=1 Tax=Trifolium pratense TaxID=57577 RepID=A0ACB0KHU6_TRIPR|nr:unnamed protein product [Trifolium pratense]